MALGGSPGAFEVAVAVEAAWKTFIRKIFFLFFQRGKARIGTHEQEKRGKKPMLTLTAFRNTAFITIRGNRRRSASSCTMECK